MRYRYTRYTGEDLDGVDLEELVSKLSELLLSSGFDSPYGDPLAADDESDAETSVNDAEASGRGSGSETAADSATTEDEAAN